MSARVVARLRRTLGRRAGLLEGWQVTMTGGSHVRLIHRTGRVVITSATPSDYRVGLNLAGRLRRALKKDPRA